MEKIKVTVKQGNTGWAETFDEFDIPKIYKEITANPYNADENRFCIEIGRDGFCGVLVFNTRQLRKIQKIIGYGDLYSKSDLREFLKRIQNERITKILQKI